MTETDQEGLSFYSFIRGHDVETCPFHNVSVKHIGRYVDEFTFRLNEGNVKRHTLDRLNSFVDAVAGKRVTYQQVIA